MKRLRLVFALGLLTAAVLAPSQAPAQVSVIQTDCTPISTVPPLVRVTFAVVNLGTIPVCSVHLTPVTIGLSNADSCHILECSNPPGWGCQLESATGGAFWRTLAGAPCIPPGGKHEPFDVVLDPLYCCYNAEFDDGNGTVIFQSLVCLECEKPTGNRGGTWGRLKLMYR